MMNIKYLNPKKYIQKFLFLKMKLQKYVLRHRLNSLKPQASQTENPHLINKVQEFSRKYGTDGAGYLLAIFEKGWTEPGHMFDELGEIFSINRKLLLVGRAAEVENLAKRLAFVGAEIECMSIPHPKERDIAHIVGHSSSGYTVIIAYKDCNLANIVMDGMTYYGKHFKNINVFIESDFIGDLIPGQEIFCGIFAAYSTKKVYLTHNNMLVTTICNLNCEYCLNYTPYDKHPKHLSLDELKHSVDIYFSHIDHVGLFQLTGGEPMLYPNLHELLEYISTNYKEKIGILCFVTNGSIVPSDDFLDLCKRENIFIFLDDYTEALPRLRPTFVETSKKIRELNISYNTPKITAFVKSFPPLRANLKMSELELQRKYRNCHIGVQNFRNGKLCSCTYHAFAVNAGLIPDAPENWFDMELMTDDILDKRKLIEFRFGFNQKGSVDWCRYCNGHVTINHMFAPTAEQVKGRLAWDINAPTFLDDEVAVRHE